MDRIDQLLDSLGIDDPLMRAVTRQNIMAEMSIGLTEYMNSSTGRVHTKEQCKASRKAGGPKNCVIHKPSLHKLTGARQVLRASTLIEDICSHGVGHPNPDSAAYLNWRDKSTSWGVHGCDGCCGPLPDKYDYLEGDFPT